MKPSGNANKTIASKNWGNNKSGYISDFITFPVSFLTFVHFKTQSELTGKNGRLIIY